MKPSCVLRQITALSESGLAGCLEGERLQFTSMPGTQQGLPKSHQGPYLTEDQKEERTAAAG